jgi:hypothetical protein
VKDAARDRPKRTGSARSRSCAHARTAAENCISRGTSDGKGAPFELRLRVVREFRP